MARHSAVTVGGRALAREQQPRSGKPQLKAPLGLHFGDPYGSWGDNALSLLSAQASLSADLASPRKTADMPPDAICRITPRSGEAHLRAEGADDAAQERQQQEAAQPCDSDGLTADAGSDLPEGDNSPAPVNSGTTAAPPEDGPNGSSPPPVHQPGKKGKRCARMLRSCAYTGRCSPSCLSSCSSSSCLCTESLSRAAFISPVATGGRRGAGASMQTSWAAKWTSPPPCLTSRCALATPALQLPSAACGNLIPACYIPVSLP
jgi:hypothetical protein